MKLKKAFLLLCVTSLLLPSAVTGVASAAQNGNLGDTSSGDTDVSLSVATMFRIGGIGDLNFGTYDGSGDLALDDDVCVWTNVPGGTYRITAKGNGTDDAFVLKKAGDASKTIPYAVKWNNTSGTTGNQSLTAGVISANKSGANQVSTSCASGPSATGNFEVLLTQTNLLKAVSGTYSGVLTLTISAPL